MKRLFSLILLLGSMVSAQAQIGYKGQMIFGVDGGINHLEGYVASARVDGFLSAHSILGAGAMFERTRYDATQGDSFAVEQWIGEVHYRHALPVRRFIMLPTGGVLLGGESCDRFSEQGQWLRICRVRHRIRLRQALDDLSCTQSAISDENELR